MFSNEDETREIDVLIIGGGLSGLVAAYKIKSLAPTIEVVIAEASNVMGGQLKRTEFGEIGAKWIIEEQRYIYNLCNNLKIDLCKINLPKEYECYRCWQLDDGLFSFLVNFEVKRFIRYIDIKSRSTKKFTLRENDQSMETLIKSELLFENSRQYIRFIILFVCGANSENVTVKEFSSICNGYGGLTPLIAFITGTSSKILRFSSEDLLNTILKEIYRLSVKILLETVIVEILHYNSIVIVRDSNNKVYRCCYVIIAIPWNDVKDIHFQPKIPAEFQVSIPENSYYATSFIIKYDESHWRRNKFSGNFLYFDPPIMGQEIDSETLAGIILPGEEMCGNSSNCNSFQTINEEDHLRDVVLEKLAKCLGEQMLYPKYWVEYTFRQHSIKYLPQTKPWVRIFWSSTCNGEVSRGSLDGAVHSGYRVALQILRLLRPQNVEWKDISEIQTKLTIEKVSFFRLFESSINLYNSLCYGTALLLISLGFFCKEKIVQLIQ